MTERYVLSLLLFDGLLDWPLGDLANLRNIAMGHRFFLSGVELHLRMEK